MEEYFGVVPCTVMSMMSNDLLPSACEVDICGVVSMHALALASRDAQRAARLEQQLRRRPRQGGLLPLQQPAQALLRRRHAWTTRRSSPARSARRTPTAPCVGRVKAGADDLRPLLHRRHRRARSAATSAKARSPTTRSNTFGGAGVVRDPATCRSCCATSARTASSTTSRRTSRPRRRGPRGGDALSRLAHALAPRLTRRGRP